MQYYFSASHVTWENWLIKNRKLFEYTYITTTLEQVMCVARVMSEHLLIFIYL